MLSTLIFLKESEVLPRMKVAIFLAAEGTPALDKEGNPLHLQALIGGIPARKKFYCSIQQSSRRAVIGTSLENFLPDTWFAPVDAFSPATAPANTEYVAYIDGALRTQPQCGLAELFKAEDGSIRHVCWHVCWADAPRGWRTWERNLVRYDGGYIQLPLQATLVPLGEVGKAEPPPPWESVGQARSRMRPV